MVTVGQQLEIAFLKVHFISLSWWLSSRWLNVVNESSMVPELVPEFNYQVTKGEKERRGTYALSLSAHSDLAYVTTVLRTQTDLSNPIRST